MTLAGIPLCLQDGDGLGHLRDCERDQSRDSDHVGADLPRLVHELLRRHVLAEVVHLEAVALEDDAHDVLADVVDVALHGAQHDLARRAQALTGQVGTQEIEGGQRGPGAQHQLGHEQLALLVAPPHQLHARGQPLRDDVLRRQPRRQGLARGLLHAPLVQLQNQLLQAIEKLSVLPSSSYPPAGGPLAAATPAADARKHTLKRPDSAADRDRSRSRSSITLHPHYHPHARRGRHRSETPSGASGRTSSRPPLHGRGDRHDVPHHRTLEAAIENDDLAMASRLWITVEARKGTSSKLYAGTCRGDSLCRVGLAPWLKRSLECLRLTRHAPDPGHESATAVHADLRSAGASERGRSRDASSQRAGPGSTT